MLTTKINHQNDWEFELRLIILNTADRHTNEIYLLSNFKQLFERINFLKMYPRVFVGVYFRKSGSSNFTRLESVEVENIVQFLSINQV